MPSSHEAAVREWQPAELADLPPAASTAPVPNRLALFEVSTAAGIPRTLLDPARRAAESAGYAAGWAHGIQAARLAGSAEARAAQARAAEEAQAARGRAEQAIAALTAAADDFARRSAPALAEVEDLILSAAYTIAEAVVGATVRDDPARGTAAVSRALAALPPGPGPVTVRLHPADLAALDVAVPDDVTLVPDGTLAPGDATATSAATAVDARIASALGRVREALGLGAVR